MAKLPRKIADSVTEKSRAAHKPTRSLNRRRVREYSKTVIDSISARLSIRTAVSPPSSLRKPAATGYSTGEPEKYDA